MRDTRPCRGTNVNVCVAEGCYAEACTRLPSPHPIYDAVMADLGIDPAEVGRHRPWDFKAADVRATLAILWRDSPKNRDAVTHD